MVLKIVHRKVKLLGLALYFGTRAATPHEPALVVSRADLGTWLLNRPGFWRLTSHDEPLVTGNTTRTTEEVHRALVAVIQPVVIVARLWPREGPL